AAVRLQLHLIGRHDVPGDAAGDLDVLRLDVRLHHPGALNEQALLEGDLPLHRPLDDEIFVTGDLPIDHNARANDRVRHELLSPLRTANAFGPAAGRAPPQMSSG